MSYLRAEDDIASDHCDSEADDLRDWEDDEDEEAYDDDFPMSLEYDDDRFDYSTADEF